MSAEVYAEDGYFAVIPEWVLDADVSAQAIRLYAVLRRYADQRTGHAHPSRRTLADRLLVADVKVVDRALADLRRIGAVSVYPRVSDDGDRSSNGYLLHRAPQGRGPNATTPPNGPGGRGPEGRTPGREDHLGRGPNALTVGAERGEEPQPVEPKLVPTGQAAQLALVPPHDPFDDFWKVYPKKVGKKDARKAWARAIRTAEPARIIEVASRYPWNPERRYIKDPATWLTKGCWEDDLDAVAAGNRPRNVPGSNYGPRYMNPDPTDPANRGAFDGAF